MQHRTTDSLSGNQNQNKQSKTRSGVENKIHNAIYCILRKTYTAIQSGVSEDITFDQHRTPKAWNGNQESNKHSKTRSGMQNMKQNAIDHVLRKTCNAIWPWFEGH